MLHLLPVVLRVVCLLQDVVALKPCAAVVGHQGEEERAQDTALRRASAERDDTGGVAPQPLTVRSLGVEVLQPVVQGGAEASRCDRFRWITEEMASSVEIGTMSKLERVNEVGSREVMWSFISLSKHSVIMGVSATGR